MAREPNRNPANDRPPASKVLSCVGDEIRADSKTSSIARKVYLPLRYWEEALQEDPADYPSD